MKFKFVDNIRYYSILSIVIFHCILQFIEFNKSDIIYQGYFKESLLFLGQFLRFGNICFFMISGFLMGNKLSTSSNIIADTKAYISRRWDGLKVPTILFSTFFGILACAIPILKSFVKNLEVDTLEVIILFFHDFFFGLTWFIYNLFISYLIVLFSKYYNIQLKTMLFTTLSITVFWGINPYIKLLPISEHTSTLLGYSFYVFLGYYLESNIELFFKILIHLKKYLVIYLLIFFTIIFFNYQESKYLYENTNIFPFYNLKFSTQILALLTFGLMCVLMNEKSMYPKVANPKTETVGIYFTHGLLLYFVYFGFFTILIFIFDIKGKEEIPPKIVLPLIIFSSILVYFGSWFIVKKLSNSKYSFLIGIK